MLLLLLRLLLLGGLDLLLQLELLLLIGGQHGLNVQHRGRRYLAAGVHQNHLSTGRYDLLHLLLLLLLLLILLLTELHLSAGQVRLDLNWTGRSHRLLLGADFTSLGQQILLGLHCLRRRRWTDVGRGSLGQQLRSLGLLRCQVASDSLLLECRLGGQLRLSRGRRLLGSYVCLLLLLLLVDLVLLALLLLLILLSLLLLLLLLLSLLLGLLLLRLLGLLRDAGQG